MVKSLPTCSTSNFSWLGIQPLGSSSAFSTCHSSSDSDASFSKDKDLLQILDEALKIAEDVDLQLRLGRQDATRDPGETTSASGNPSGDDGNGTELRTRPTTDRNVLRTPPHFK